MKAKGLITSADEVQENYRKRCDRILDQTRKTEVHAKKSQDNKAAGAARSLERMKRLADPVAQNNLTDYSKKIAKMLEALDWRVDDLRQPPKTGSGINIISLVDWEPLILANPLPQMEPVLIGSAAAWSD